MKKILLLVLVAFGTLTTFAISEASFKPEQQMKPLKSGGINKSVSDQVEISVSDENLDQQEDLSQGKGNVNKVNNNGEENKIRTTEQEKKEDAQNGPNEIALQKRSEVSNRVHELLELADRVGGIGEQVRAFAQAQNEKMAEIEEAVSEIESRSGFAKFLVGVKNDKVKEAKELLAENKQKLEILKNLKAEIKKAEDLETFEKAVSQIEEYIKEIDDKVTEEVKGFSLFGWLFK